MEIPEELATDAEPGRVETRRSLVTGACQGRTNATNRLQLIQANTSNRRPPPHQVQYSLVYRF